MNYSKKALLSTILFWILVLRISYSNKNILFNFYKQSAIENINEITEVSEKELLDNLKEKNFFIELNGMMAKCLGMKKVNNTHKLTNGWLISSITFYSDKKDFILKISELRDFLREQNIELLCVPIPSKEVFYDIDFPLGYESDGHRNIIEFCNELDSLGIENINMDTWFQKNGWKMEDTYFKTDHHWKPEAAFVTTNEIMKKMSKLDSKIIYNSELFSEKNWTKKTYKNWFLGARGKRTGASYAGYDDLCYIYPDFKTKFIVDRFSEERELYVNSINELYIEQYLDEPNYYDESPYCLYLGSDYPLAYIRNELALNDKKIIVIGDSFRLPVEVFLATQFSEIYHIDMRHYIDGTFLEFVKSINPDYVFMIFNGPDDGECHQYGLDEWNSRFNFKSEKYVFSIDKIFLEKTTGSNDGCVLYSNLKNGAYKMKIGKVLLQQNSESKDIKSGNIVKASVINIQNGSTLCSRYFISEYDEEQEWYFSIPNNEDANYAIIIYNGMDGNTNLNSTEINSISFYMYE